MSATIPKPEDRRASSEARPLILVIQLETESSCKTLYNNQSLKKEYDVVNVCINSIQYAQATRSAFAYQRPAFASVIIFTFDRFKPITSVRQNSD
uniref:Uncharacterized protein n=1 Tax=Hyaloperonospora arabidopsidis (strain Emoy2) TaxID=559515 RepID=M4B4E3_HYAAE